MKKYFHALVCILTLCTTTAQAYHLTTNLLFTARLSGDQESPQVVTDGQGVAMFSIDQKRGVLYVHGQFSHLSGPVTGVHIHEGEPGVPGPVVVDLSPFVNGTTLEGSLKELPAEILTGMLSGQYYINVHTEANPDGEIRGQIALETEYRYSALMNGFSEVPSVASTARGLGIFELNQAQTEVRFRVVFGGLTSAVTGAHIHNAPIGTNGGVVYDLTPFIQGNTIQGTWEPGPLLSALLAGELYINVHTENNPGGEIRGQIFLLPGMTFDARLSGNQEVPVVNTPANGLGIVTIRPDLTEFEYYIVFEGLSGAPTGAHFHRAPIGTNGGVVVDISNEFLENSITGSTPLNANLFDALMAGGLYVNIHTAAHPGGEIRGQVVSLAREPFLYKLDGNQEVPPVTTSALGAGMVSISRDRTSAHFMIVYDGLEGSFSSSHFHHAAPGTTGGVIYDITGEYNAFGGAFGYWDSSSTPAFDAAPFFDSNDVYINVHSDVHPAGEIRGNIVRARRLFLEPPFDPHFGDNLILVAALTGDNEEPAVSTDAVGLATLYFDGDKHTAQINVTANGLFGPITGMHIHEGDPGTNGPVQFALSPVGNRAQEEITGITDLQLTSLFNGAMYINIHTEANPDGEIRGQLSLDQDLTFVAALSGDEEVPAVTTDGRGLAIFHWNGNVPPTMEVNVQLTGLSSPITGAHIHTGQAGETGPVAFDLGDMINGNILRGTLTDITTLDLINLLFGNFYLNVHTADNTDGEIRGQLNYLPGVVFDGWMSPAQEVNPPISPSSGLAVATIYPGPNDIAVWMLTDKASGPIQAAHLHEAPLGVNGNVVHDLSADLFGNGLVHLGVLQPGVLSALLKGEIYINAHTASFPGGELRGQLFRLARDGYGFDICPEQEVNLPNAPFATGSGWVSVDRLHTNLNIGAVVDGLTGPITASHIHRAPPGTNGGVALDLISFYSGNAMSVLGLPSDTALINPIRAGKAYVNVHTAQHPGGELRGQIVKEFLCSIQVGVDPLADHLEDVRLSPVPVTDVLNIDLDVLLPGEYAIAMVDLTGRTLTSSIHTLVSGANRVSLFTDQLAPGFYAVVISTGRAAQAFKFIK